jgi:KaiC domain protein
MSEDDDEDWFERAMQEESDDTPDEPAENGDTDAAGDSPFADEDDPAVADGESERPFGGDGSDGDDSPFGGGDAGSDDGGDSPLAGGDGEDDSPFGGESDGDDSPFGGGDGGDSPFGTGDSGGDGESELFDDDFDSAFGGGGDGGEFDDEEFESDIPRIDLGITGLDNMIQGGVPGRHLIVAIGSAGTGKTTFGLQFLHHGLQKEDPDKAVFITLEQSYEAIVDTAAEFGWDFEHFEEEDMLAVIDLDPVEMANSLQNIRAELPELIRQFGADRLVLDSVSLLEMMYDRQAKRRTEVFDFTRSLKNSGVTTMLTSEASEDNPYASRHGIIEYLTDAVIFLQYVRQSNRETRTAVEIQKIRNANHSRETKPYEITEGGIDVFEQANIF